MLYNSFNSWGWLDHAPKDIRNNLDVFFGDVRDPHGVKEPMAGCDAMLHLAAFIAVLTPSIRHCSLIKGI